MPTAPGVLCLPHPMSSIFGAARGCGARAPSAAGLTVIAAHGRVDGHQHAAAERADHGHAERLPDTLAAGVLDPSDAPVLVAPVDAQLRRDGLGHGELDGLDGLLLAPPFREHGRSLVAAALRV